MTLTEKLLMTKEAQDHLYHVLFSLTDVSLQFSGTHTAHTPDGAQSEQLSKQE